MEERRLWVFENRVLKRIFVPKRDAVTGEWRSEELSDLYISPKYCVVIKKKRMRCGRACNTNVGGEMRVQGFGGETGEKESTA